MKYRFWLISAYVIEGIATVVYWICLGIGKATERLDLIHSKIDIELSNITGVLFDSRDDIYVEDTDGDVVGYIDESGEFFEDWE